MSESCMGAKVKYCGHEGMFVADIFRVGNTNVVVTEENVRGDTLVRGEALDGATHHISDSPSAGYWSPRKGIFVVPEEQVIDLRKQRQDDIKP